LNKTRLNLSSTSFIRKPMRIDVHPRCGTGGRESPFINRSKRRGLTDYGRGRELPSTRRKTPKVSERRGDLADETMGSSLLSMFRTLASNERTHSISDTERKPLDLALRGTRIGYPVSLRRAAKVLQKPLRVLRRLGTVEGQLRSALDTGEYAMNPRKTLIWSGGCGLVCFTNLRPHRPSAHSLFVECAG
jgi:hypothetical protein